MKKILLAVGVTTIPPVLHLMEKFPNIAQNILITSAVCIALAILSIKFKIFPHDKALSAIPLFGYALTLNTLSKETLIQMGMTAYGWSIIKLMEFYGYPFLAEFHMLSNAILIGAILGLILSIILE